MDDVSSNFESVNDAYAPKNSGPQAEHQAARVKIRPSPPKIAAHASSDMQTIETISSRSLRDGGVWGQSPLSIRALTVLQDGAAFACMTV
jgi:hypothetical protein